MQHDDTHDVLDVVLPVKEAVCDDIAVVVDTAEVETAAEPEEQETAAELEPAEKETLEGPAVKSKKKRSHRELSGLELQPGWALRGTGRVNGWWGKYTTGQQICVRLADGIALYGRRCDAVHVSATVAAVSATTDAPVAAAVDINVCLQRLDVHRARGGPVRPACGVGALQAPGQDGPH
jgi:hypothetical protein